MSGGLLFAALLAGLGGPDAASVQQAYDAARSEAGARHADDLRIRTAQCAPLRELSANARYACQIDFVRTAAPEGRLYFTVVTIERRGGAWTLLGGLCKSPA